MKRRIRRGVFETNSSSVHSLTMCTKSDYDKWVNGEYVYDYNEEKLIQITEEIQKSIDLDERKYLTHKQFEDYDYNIYETFYRNLITKNGDEVVAFGYYG